MMPNNLPFFSHFFPNYYSRYHYGANNFRRTYMNNNKSQQNNKGYSSNYTHKTSEVNSSHESYSENTKHSSDCDDTILEIFGIKLHQDDLLLIGLIFFLYTEGVKDEFLFIALILLLLS